MKATRKFANFSWGNLSMEFGAGFSAYGAGIRFFGEDNTISIALHWHYSLYLGLSIDAINKLVKSYEHGRRLGIHVSGKYLTVDLLNDAGHSALFWDWWEFITGKPVYSDETLNMGPCEVIMPENRYQADYVVKRQSWRFPRWLVVKQRDTITVNIEGNGIPIPGKGENSWDQGDDAVRSVTTTTDWDNDRMSLRLALEDLAITTLKRRQRYASLDWLPRDEADEIIEEHAKITKDMVAGATDQCLGK